MAPQGDRPLSAAEYLLVGTAHGGAAATAEVSSPLGGAPAQAREPWSRPRLCAGAAGACALALAAGASLAVAVGARASPAREARAERFLVPARAPARVLMSPPPDPAWGAWPPSGAASAMAGAEAPGAARRRLFQLLEDPGGTVSVRASNGGYVSVTEDGQIGSEASIGEWERFGLLEHSDGTISLKAWTGVYIGASGGKMGVSSKIGSTERLKRVEKQDGAIMIEASDGRYLSSEAFSDQPGRFAIHTRHATGAGDAEKFHVEANPDGTVSFTCLHGAYLSVEDSASVVSGSLTVGREEKFRRHQNSDGTVSLFAVRTGRYLTAHQNGTVLAKASRPGKLENFQLAEHNDTDGSISFSFKASDGTYLSVSRIPVFTFYMYRSQGNVDYPWRSVNTGNLAGVLWYLHNEVVTSTPRKFGIQRIVRMKVQTTSTKALSERGLNFGVRFAYDSGNCTGAGPINGYSSCRGFYARLGHFVGCNYLGDYPFPMASKGFPSYYDRGIWYSLPKAGNCDGVPTGEDNCTYSTEEAGSVDIDDLYGMGSNFSAWYNDPNSREYVAELDTGIGSDFWKGKTDMEANNKRVKRAFELFDEKYPDMPSGEDYPYSAGGNGVWPK
ncbi:unnamed protein product [Prorocentrum cordatum]|uniref:Fascin-like domain-containing protein n=1 Tax=Prorocentrum cordatum TaxID=2364126 RepID=A0ABN9PKE0_9DINO|nr:unnamed protein product [Polarella glacialis]